jgi:hypothetical protein
MIMIDSSIDTAASRRLASLRILLVAMTPSQRRWIPSQRPFMLVSTLKAQRSVPYGVRLDSIWYLVSSSARPRISVS